MAAHFVNGEDCMGRSEQYWREFLTCSDGTVVSGYGGNAEDAEHNAKTELELHELFLKQPLEEQLQDIVSRGHILSSDMERAIKLITKIILKK